MRGVIDVMECDGAPALPRATEVVLDAFFGGDERLVRAWWAVRINGEGIREAAGRLGIDYSTLSRKLAAWERFARKWLERDPAVAAVLAGDPGAGGE